MNYLLVVDDSPIDRQLVRSLLERRLTYQVEFASNGWEALEQIESQLPLAIITDLQMPEMDGLQLTDAVRRRFATVPVILMTAHGSEEIAAEALARGAADFVPKSKLATELCHAVESVLAVSTGSSGEQRLSHCLRFEQSRYELDNDVLLIPPLVEHLQRTARELNLVDDGDRIRLAKALVEALRNAIYHGNLELSSEEVAQARISPGCCETVLQRRQVAPYCLRHVTIESSISPEEGRFTIRDEGPGFDTQSLLNVAGDRLQLANSERRGLVLIKMFMDEVSFNARGNEITLVIRQRHPAQVETRIRTSVAAIPPAAAAV